MKFSDLDQKYYLHNANLKAILSEIANGSTNGKLLSMPTVSIGTTSATKVKVGNFEYVKDGVFHSVTGGEVAFTATDHDIADHSEAVFVISCKLADDSLVITKGESVLTAEASAVAPVTPDGHLKLGEVKVATEGAIFDATTTNLSAVTVTDTYTTKTDIFSF